jgi:hypothetical protein
MFFSAFVALNMKCEDCFHIKVAAIVSICIDPSPTKVFCLPFENAFMRGYVQVFPIRRRLVDQIVTKLMKSITELTARLIKFL